MKTEKKYSHKDTKTQRMNNIYFKNSCLSALVAKKGFTLVEVLTAVMIVAIMVSVLVPALNMVRKMARDVQQKAQIASIEVGINLYKNDLGDYPASHGYNSTATNGADYKYCGAQTLVEAMFGQDLLGVDPNTKYESGAPNDFADEYIPGNNAYKPDNRKGPYLDRTHFNVLPTEEVFKTSFTNLEKKKYVICDVFTQYSAMPKNMPNYKKKLKIGSPILYYKANISANQNDNSNKLAREASIYNCYDNAYLTVINKVSDPAKKHNLMLNPNDWSPFYEFIKDPLASTSTLNRPVRPDSFILISAGNDGLYGTSDDICNFEPNIE
ncbi:MAG: type II secretion system protein [Phycisphaerales bacterium]